MGAVFFYHLTRTPIEATLPTLLDKALGAGWRIDVRGQDAVRMQWLDEKLWLGPGERFMPHGLEGGDFEEEQPILLTHTETLRDSARCLMAVDGAHVGAVEVQKLERTCILFDGNDPAAVQTARAQWKTLTDEDCEAEYWSQETGAWQKKASANQPSA